MALISGVRINNETSLVGKDLILSNLYILHQKLVRGIPADVWVAERYLTEANRPLGNWKDHLDEDFLPSTKGRPGYQTTELYFSTADWRLIVEEADAHQSLPLGMATYFADSVS